MAPEDVSEALGLLKEEYAALKREQVNRIGVRDNLLYFTLGSVATVATVTAVAKAPPLLLMMPLAAVILGWTYLMNDAMISAIGRYLRVEAGPQMKELLPDSGHLLPLRWEHNHTGDIRRRQRKLIQLGVDLAAFTIPSLVAVIVYWTMGPTSAWLVLLSLLELAAVGVLAWQMVTYAEL